MKSALLVVSAVFSMFAYTHIFADSPDESVAESRANLAAEFAQCSAYYMIAADGVRRHDEVDLANSLKEASEIVTLVPF